MLLFEEFLFCKTSRIKFTRFHENIMLKKAIVISSKLKNIYTGRQISSVDENEWRWKQKAKKRNVETSKKSTHTFYLTRDRIYFQVVVSSYNEMYTLYTLFSFSSLNMTLSWPLFVNTFYKLIVSFVMYFTFIITTVNGTSRKWIPKKKYEFIWKSRKILAKHIVYIRRKSIF